MRVLDHINYFNIDVDQIDKARQNRQLDDRL